MDCNLEGFARLGALTTASELSRSPVGVHHPWWEQCVATYRSTGDAFVDRLHNFKNRVKLSESQVNVTDVPLQSKADLYVMYKVLNKKLSHAHELMAGTSGTCC